MLLDNLNRIYTFVGLLSVLLFADNSYGQSYNISTNNGDTVYSCVGSFTDSGGNNGNYSNDESNTITICKDDPDPDLCLHMFFSQFSIENNWDFLYVYDGNSTSAPLIGAYTGTNSPGNIIASGACLTFYFTSDFQISNFPGWNASISCGICLDEPDFSIADCIGALTICDDVQNEDTPLDGAGNVLSELPPNDCFMTEVNVLWYVFDVGSDGIFNFELEADPQLNGDYDWVVYDITGLSCNDLSNAESVSCNTWGLPTGTLVQNTGISTALGGSGTANGPGNFNGPAFNEDLNVLQGETYALVISNCCGASAGFEIDFSSSTADIFDNYAPLIEGVYSSCGNNEVNIVFNELIDCTTISELDFQVSGNNIDFNTLSASAEWCDNGLDGTTSIDVFLDGFMDENEDYTITITDLAEGVSDQCGNVIMNETVDFSTSTPISITTNLSPDDCVSSTPTGEAEIIVSGGVAPYFVQIANQSVFDEVVYLFTDLTFGQQLVEVFDLNGCHASFLIDIPSSNSSMVNDVITSNVSCIGEDGQFEVFTSGDSGFGPWNYSLVDSTGMLISTANDTNYFFASGLPIASYFLTVEDLSGLSPCPDLIEIVIGGANQVVIETNSDTTICYNGQASFSAWLANGNLNSDLTVFWQNDSISFTTDINQIEVLSQFTSSQYYLVYAQDEFGCFSDTIPFNVNVADLISFTVSPDQTLCPDTELEIGVANISGGYGIDYSVIWTYENGLNVEENSITVQPDSLSTYCVNVSDICETPDVDSCITITPVSDISVEFTIDSDTSSCPPFLATFTNTSDPSTFISATWYFGDGNGETSVNSTVSHLYEESGTFNVALSLTSPDGCVFDTIWENAIYIYPVPHPYFIMTPQIATLENTTVEFNNQSVGASSYYWIFDTINFLGESYTEDPFYNFPDLIADEYYVQLFAYNNYGCEKSVTQLLIVREDQTLYIPNSFTPNGDGDNDYFFVKGVELDPNAYSLLIYDRWGSIVFETNDIHARWNGSINGGEYYSQTSVFVYHLSYQVNGTLEGEEVIGTVTLLK